MSDVNFQETLAVPSVASDCMEAAWQTLVSLGSKPVFDGPTLTADFGSIIKTRGPQMLLCPLDWLPIRVTVVVWEVGVPGVGQRGLLIHVGDRFPFAPIILGRSRYSKRCQQAATSVKAGIAARLAQSQSPLGPTTP